jgi:putative oxidoreductase
VAALDYGLATVVHAVSVAATWRQLLNPCVDSNHLFIAGTPVLAAFIALYMLRDADGYSVEGRIVARIR